MDGKRQVECFVGVNVAKAGIDVPIHPGCERFAWTADGEGLNTLVSWLTGLQCLIVPKASGGDEGVVAVVLTEAGLPIAVVNSRQMRRFAGAIGRLATIDAALTGHFAEAMRSGLSSDIGK